jgi:hypothetical protein
MLDVAYIVERVTYNKQYGELGSAQEGCDGSAALPQMDPDR